MSILSRIKERIGNSWDSFLETLRSEATSQLSTERNTDGISIEFKFFLDLLRSQYNINLNEVESTTLIKTFGAKTEGNSSQKLNLKPIMQLANH